MSGGKDAGGKGRPAGGVIRKRLKVILITFLIMFFAWLALFLSTEDVSIAPFVYAIF